MAEEPTQNDNDDPSKAEDGEENADLEKDEEQEEQAPEAQGGAE